MGVQLMRNVFECEKCGSTVEPEWNQCEKCGEKLSSSLSSTPHGNPPNADRQPDRTFQDEDYAPDMVIIPPGAFMMGSPMEESERDSAEGPQHQVVIETAFALGRYAVTFDEFDYFVRAAGYEHHPEDEGWGRGNHPAIYVSWDDAQAYVDWLSGEVGAEYRLPSEAEWEYACRAGTTTPFSFGEVVHTSQANHNCNRTYGASAEGEYREKTVPVGTFPENAFGLHEMHGNVWEWVEDCWNGSYRGAPTDGSAWKDGNCSRPVLRGGAWDYFPKNLRSASRVRYISTAVRNSSAGFRIARTLETKA